MWIHPCKGPRGTLNVFLYSKPPNCVRQGFSLNTKTIAQEPGWPVAPGPTLQCWGYRTGTLGFCELLQQVVLFAKPAPSPSISILTVGAEMRLVLRTCVLVTTPLLNTQTTPHGVRALPAPVFSSGPPAPQKVSTWARHSRNCLWNGPYVHFLLQLLH